MQTIQLLEEIKRLSPSARLHIVEETIRSIKQDEVRQQMELAAQELYANYISDTELTVFTSLDLEHFYEAR